jgi:hypothetical protein
VKNNLYIIVDVSGSMSEGGKLLITRGVARAMEQYCRLGYGCADLKLIVWGKNARVVEWTLDEELPEVILFCEKEANAESLITLLGEQPDYKLLLITDGFWAKDDSKAMKNWRASLQENRLRIIKIGADANPRLKGNDVFDAEDLLIALDGWLEGGVA